MTSKIHPQLAPLARPLDELHLLPGNPRRGEVEAIARILDRFGQRKPITALAEPFTAADGTEYAAGTITAGNHTYLAARHLGWDELAVVTIADDEAVAKAWAAADNRVAEMGSYDAAELVALLKDVESFDEELLRVAGYGSADLDDLLASLQEFTPVDIEHRPAEDRDAGEGSHVEPSLPERLNDYMSKGVRSVVLDYALEDYERVAKMAAELREAWSVTSNAVLFRELLERALA